MRLSRSNPFGGASILLVTSSLLAACGGAPSKNEADESIAQTTRQVAEAFTTAAASRSGDSAVARMPSTLDVFYVHPKLRAVMRRFYDSIGGWQTEPIATQTSLVESTPIASVARTSVQLDVFWADEAGNLMTAYWNSKPGVWASRAVLLASSANQIPPHAPLTAVSQTPSTIDVFYVGNDGAVRTVNYNDVLGYQGAGPISAAGLAAPGTGVAAVAPSSTELDVFFIGTNGQLYQSVSYHNHGWGPATLVPNQTGVLAPRISGITATARSATNLDVFWAANDGTLQWATLQNGTAHTNGTLTGNWVVGPISPSGVPAIPGENLSAIAISGDTPEIDVSYTGHDLSTYVAKGPMSPGFPYQPWPTGVIIPSSDYLASPTARISLAAPSATTRDVLIDSASRLVASSASGGSAWADVNLTYVKPAYASLDAVTVSSNNTLSLSTYRSNGTGFGAASTWYTKARPSMGVQWVAGDFNGDGLAEVATILDSADTNMIESRESIPGSSTDTIWPDTTGRYGGYLAGTIWLGGDFDGDGIDELLGVWPNGANTGFGVCTALSGCVQWGTSPGWDPNAHWMAADFDGDGKTDIAEAWNYSGTAALAIHASTGSTLAAPIGLPFNAGGWEPSTMYFAGDFTGDGKADVAAVWNSPGGTTGSTSVAVIGSGGKAFVGGTQWITNAGWDSTSKWVAGDFNGDGKADLATVWSNGGTSVIAMRQSTGSAFAVYTWQTNAGTFAASTLWLGGKFN